MSEPTEKLWKRISLERADVLEAKAALFDEMRARLQHGVDTTICICKQLRLIATSDTQDTVCDRCKDESVLERANKIAGAK